MNKLAGDPFFEAIFPCFQTGCETIVIVKFSDIIDLHKITSKVNVNKNV